MNTNLSMVLCVECGKHPGAYIRFCVMKNLKLSYDFIGKKLQLMFSEPYLAVLSNCLPQDEDSAAMVDYMRAILKLHKSAVRKELDNETMVHVQDIEDFRIAFDKVHQSSYEVPETLKVHVLKEHLIQFFVLTNESCAKYYDGHIEAMHGNQRRIEETMCLKVNEESGEKSGENLLILHKRINNANKHFE